MISSMPRALEFILWFLSGALAIACYFLSGFYGWASILVWSVAALPLIVFRRRSSASGEQWPSRTLVRTWVIAAVLNVVVGFGPTFRPRAPRIVEWTMVVLAWIAFVCSAVVISRITYEAVVRRARAA